MATLLFKLQNVPDDEAQEVRELLVQSGFDVYETEAGRWRSGVAAIWLADDSQLGEARAVLNQYQMERVVRVRQAYRELQASGDAPTFWHKVTHSPLQFFAYCLAAGLLLALMTLPFAAFFLDL